MDALSIALFVIVLPWVLPIVALGAALAVQPARTSARLPPRYHAAVSIAPAGWMRVGLIRLSGLLFIAVALCLELPAHRLFESLL